MQKEIFGGRRAGRTREKHISMLDNLKQGCTIMFGNEDSWQGFRNFMKAEKLMGLYKEAFQDKRILINTN